MIMYNPYAPIIPRIGLGGFRLNMSKEEAESVLGYSLKDGEEMHDGAWIVYKVGDVLSLFFSVKQNKLKVIETDSGYKGLLMERICTSTDEAELLRLDPTLIYDEFEEFYKSEVNGYQIETSIPDHKAVWISIAADDWTESRQAGRSVFL